MGQTTWKDALALILLSLAAIEGNCKQLSRPRGRLMKLRWTIACLLLIGFSHAPALAEKRVALVIGNGAYVNVSPLINPVHDADAVAARA